MDKDIPYKSKTQEKKEAEHLQKLGEELMNLPLARLRRMDLPGDLMAALVDGQTITSNVARRRHRQYIGALMRDVDPVPIRHAMAFTENPGPVVSQADLEINAWIERLLSKDNSAVEECLDLCPDLDRQRLRQLIRNIQKGGKGKAGAKSKRALETLLRENLKG